MPETRRKTQAVSKKAVPAKNTPKPKATPKARKPTAAQQMDEFRVFMNQQADINRTLLDTLQGLNKDKSVDSGASGVGQGHDTVRPGGSGSGIRSKTLKRLDEIEVLVLSSSDMSGSDSDQEDRIRSDISEANSLLQVRFTRTKGKDKSTKQIEKEIKTNRPFACLDHDIQRQFTKLNEDPEELSIM